jgi:truncated hemoglobin YjbI
MHTTMRWARAAVVMAALGVLALGLPAAARQGGDDDAFKKNADKAIVDVINHGAALFNNQNDYNGCYRLYEGCLMTLRPQLGKFPELQKAIDEGIREANTLGRADLRAHALRKVLNEIRYTFNPALRPVVSLWDRVGGEPVVSKVIAELMASAAKDPAVNFTRNGKYPISHQKAAQLHKSLVSFVSQATGGPYKYTGPSMKDVHKGMGITDAEFDALGGHLKKALERNGVKADDVKTILGAVEGLRKDIVEPAGDKKQTLWDRLGGEANVAKVVDEFVKTAAADPDVNFDRGGKIKLDDATVAHVKKQLVVFISHLTGGPYTYKGKDMKEAHKGMGITEKEFNASAGHLKKALEKYGAKPADVAEVLKAIAATRPAIVEDKKGDDKQVEQPDPNMAVVKGVVTFKGQPLGHGFVTFVDGGGRKFSANIQKDGTYVFKKGFPPGQYKVLIEQTTTPPEPGEVRPPIPAVFQSEATTPLTYQASKGKGVNDIVLK